ncbi:Cysteine and glycine-rich protein 3 [Mycena chlorophos]|uniref:Cysteine-rich protein 1 n=1 Tax=Mycena chlorophos TaxID=658473 RepID=A0A8H6WN31_MYCCL|nr:Cysteine and glycine-rich protein 3 [Mycena chlorophos]
MSAVCPRCSKVVYHMEQVVGPGRKFYHKPCLSCVTCKKRLDSYSLVEHDQEPYCKRCHSLAFGTHNPGQRNVDPLTTPPRTRTTDVVTSPTSDDEASPSRPSHTGRFGPEALPRTVNLTPTRTNDDTTADNEGSETHASPTAPVAERYAAAAAVQRRHMTGDVFSSSPGSPPRPIPRSLTGGSPSPRRTFGGDNPKCARCTKTVYFAEQVKAVGKIYHKGCLRCVECNALLDSNRLRDHDGEPLCASCHTKLHGPQGLRK